MHYTENTKKEQIKVTRKSDLEFIKLAGFMKKKTESEVLHFILEFRLIKVSSEVQKIIKLG